MKTTYLVIDLENESRGALESRACWTLGGCHDELFCDMVFIKRDPSLNDLEKIGAEVHMRTRSLYAGVDIEAVSVEIVKTTHGELPINQGMCVISATPELADKLDHYPLDVRSLVFQSAATSRDMVIPLWGVVRTIEIDSPARIDAPYQRGSKTSKDAAINIARRAPNLRERVMEYIASQGSRGATDYEIHTATGIRYTTVNPRRNELEKLGKIVKTNRRRRTQGTSRAAVYIATSAERQLDLLG